MGFDVACGDGLMWFSRGEYTLEGRKEKEEEGKMEKGKGPRARFWGVGMGWVEAWFGEEGWRGREEGENGGRRGREEMVVGDGVREPFFVG